MFQMCVCVCFHIPSTCSFYASIFNLHFNLRVYTIAHSGQTKCLLWFNANWRLLPVFVCGNGEIRNIPPRDVRSPESVQNSAQCTVYQVKVCKSRNKIIYSAVSCQHDDSRPHGGVHFKK